MLKLEYHIETLNAEDRITAEQLNALGADGWILSHVVPLNEPWYDYIDGRDYSGVNHKKQLIFSRTV